MNLIIIGAVLGLIIALVATAVMKSSMKPVSKATNARSYMVPNSFKLTHRNVIFLRRDVRRTPRPKQQPQQKK